jgi:hypothetical protein
MRFVHQQALPELDRFKAGLEETLVTHPLNVSTHDPTNLMLDASVSLNTAAFAASDVGFHSAG